jgi:mannosyltransferase
MASDTVARRTEVANVHAGTHAVAGTDVERGGVVAPVIGLAVLAIVVSVVQLGSKSLWNDEGITWQYATGPWSDLWQLVSDDKGHMALYYLAARGWLGLVGESETAARLLSVLGAAIALPLAYLVARRLVSRSVALIGCLLLGVNAFFVKYAQELRAYSFVLAAACAATLAFVHLVEHPSRRRGVVYGAVVGLSLYLQFFSALIPLAHLASLLALPHERRPWRALVPAGVVAAVLAAPIALGFLTGGTGGGLGWVDSPSVHQVVHVGYDLTSARGHVESTDALAVGMLALYLGCALVGVGACVGIWRRGRSEAAWRTAVLVAWAAVPLATSLAASLVRPMFAGRYLILVLPAIAMLVALGLVQLSFVWRSLVAASLVVLSALALVSWYDAPPFESWREAVDELAASAQPGDAVVVYPSGISSTYAYYRERATLPSDVRMVFPPEPSAYEDDSDVMQAVRDAAPSRVWLFTNDDSSEQDTAEIRSRLSSEYELTRSWHGVRINLELYEPRDL